jgi:ATP/maltotriose-dependent transcriptional regulator MalT
MPTPPLLDRPRLSRLDPTRPITVICALPGSGKTVLVDQIVAAGNASTPIEAQSIRDRRRLRVAAPPPLAELLQSVGTPIGPNIDPELYARISELFHQYGDEILVAADNVAPTDPEFEQWVGADMRTMAIAGVVWVTAGRVYPVWPLATWRVEGLLQIVTDQDMAFTLDEMVEAVSGPDGETPGWIEALHARSEGWAAAVAAARALLRVHPSGPDVRMFDRLVDDLADHLSAKVLSQLPTDERQTLLLASVAPEMSAELADEIGAPGSGQRLLALARANPCLVPDEDEPDWFRLHPLLRRGLQRELDAGGDASRGELAARVAGWHRREGQASRAIEMLIAGRRWEEAVDLLMDTSLEYAEANAHGAFMALVDRIPRSVWASDPRMALHLTIMSASAGREELADAVLARSPLTDHDLAKGYVAVADVFRAWMISYSTPAETALAAAERARVALASVEEEDLPEITGIRARRPYEHIVDIAACRAQTDLHRWAEARTDLAAIAQDPEVGFLVRLNARSALAWVLARRGEIGAACQTALDAQVAATEAGVPDSQALAEANLALAGSAVWRGDHAAARAALEAAERQAGRHQAQLPLTAAAVLRATVEVREGDPDAALAILDRGGLRATGALHLAASALRSRALLRAGEAARARAVARALPLGVDTVVALAETMAPGDDLAVDRSAWPVPSWPSALLVGALAEAIAAANRDEPVVAIHDAVAVARVEGMFGPFLELGA